MEELVVMSGWLAGQAVSLDTPVQSCEPLNTAVGGQTAAVHTCTRQLEHDGKTSLTTTTSVFVRCCVGSTNPSGLPGRAACGGGGTLTSPARYIPLTEQWLQAYPHVLPLALVGYTHTLYS